MSNTSLNNAKDPYITETTNIAKAAPGFLYTFDSGIVTSQGGRYITGAWRAVTPEDLGTSIGTVNVSGIDSLIVDLDDVEALAQSGNQFLASISGGIQSLVSGGLYAPTFLAITSGQAQIPTGVKSWSVGIESGTAFLNGVAMNAQMAINGGDYDGRYRLGTAINVGITGGRVVLTYEV